MGRTLAVGAGALVLTVLTATPALADPAGPTNYESTILAVEPASNVVSFEVIGGDAFLGVEVAPGHTLLVPGYAGEPYVRIDADGRVWVNEDSKALYVNEDRYGRVEPPADADGLGEPRWTQVGSNGTYAWHDHRVHWMSEYAPPAVAGDTRQLVFPWRIPIEVDGVTAVISGELTWIPDTNPTGFVVLGVAAAAAMGLAWRRPEIVPAIVIVAAVLATVTIIAQNNGTPPSARGLPIWVIFPLGAVAATVIALTRGGAFGLRRAHLLMVGGMALALWAYSTIEVLWMPILASAMPAAIERAVVAVVFGAGAGAAVVSAAAAIRDARFDATAPSGS